MRTLSFLYFSLYHFLSPKTKCKHNYYEQQINLLFEERQMLTCTSFVRNESPSSSMSFGKKPFSVSPSVCHASESLTDAIINTISCLIIKEFVGNNCMWCNQGTIKMVVCSSFASSSSLWPLQLVPPLPLQNQNDLPQCFTS